MNRLLLCASLLLAVPLVAGCPSGDPCGDPIYASGSTDEAWLTMVDGEDSVKTDDANAATITSPEEGAELPADGAAPLIEWTSPLSASIDRPVLRDDRRIALSPRPVRTPSIAERLLDFVVPAAHAHEPPVTGPMYLLEIAVPGESCPVRVLTAKEQWQVGDDTWALLKEHAGETITLTITSAYLTENRITEGPYRASSPRTFSVK